MQCICIEHVLCVLYIVYRVLCFVVLRIAWCGMVRFGVVWCGVVWYVCMCVCMYVGR